MIIKLIGLGIEKYFDDSWNVFDFSMVILSTLSLALSTTLSFLRSAKSAKATKLLRLTKVNKLFRIFKALRSIKFMNLLFSGAELFYQVKLLVQKILMCLPIGKSQMISNKTKNIFLFSFNLLFLSLLFSYSSDSCEPHAHVHIFIYCSRNLQHRYIRI